MDATATSYLVGEKFNSLFVPSLFQRIDINDKWFSLSFMIKEILHEIQGHKYKNAPSEISLPQISEFNFFLTEFLKNP